MVEAGVERKKHEEEIEKRNETNHNGLSEVLKEGGLSEA